EEDWYNRTGLIDQSQARATSQAPSIRVYHTGHDARCMRYLIRVLLWLAAFLPRMLLEHKKTQDWLSPGGPTCLRPDPTPQHLGQAPTTRVHHAGHAAHYILLLSRVLLWLADYFPRMPLEHRETRDWLSPGDPTCLRSDPTPHSLPLSGEAVLSFWLVSLHCS
uniref:Pecanex-like protein n=1 Tax=Mesocestoides corti TaxID=53468 RepID=A0A5K3EXM6_MESCO